MLSAFRLPPAREAGYSPLLFLAALGAGGLTVTFFLWLNFWVPHPGRAVPVFEDIATALAAGPLPRQAMIALAWTGIAVFAVLHLRLLLWNLRALAAWRGTPAAAALRAGNAETQLLAVPLTLAMTVNVSFILGLVFVPRLTAVIEWLFVPAMAAFLAIGVHALRLMGGFFGRVLVSGGFDCARNNSFAQLLPAFALSMVAVGLAAPAALSGSAAVAGASYVLSSFFAVAAMASGAVALVLGFRAMMENGASVEAAPTLWIVVPILTVLAIALMRQGHGLHAHFGVHGGGAGAFAMLTWMLAGQVLFGLLGWVVLRRTGYFGRHVSGRERAPGAWALICPGVALAVMVQFWVNKGLVPAGLVAKFDAGYWAATAVALALQLATVWLFATLHARQFGAGPAGRAQPAGAR